jgi:hypothetical protein
MQFASGSVKRRVDPLRTVDLQPYLRVAPFLGGLLYVATLVAQQKFPKVFPFAYIGSVLLLVLPVIVIVFTL